MELSRGQLIAIIGAVVAVVVLVVGWTMFKPAGGGDAGGASQVDMLSTDPQFAQPNAGSNDATGAAPAGNAPM
ncbi:MAG: hypothetical protein ACO1SX_11525 [Actinomycetota bacterium]